VNGAEFLSYDFSMEMKMIKRTSND